MNSSMGIQLSRIAVSQPKFGKFRLTDWRPTAFWQSERSRNASPMTLVTRIQKPTVTSPSDCDPTGQKVPVEPLYYLPSISDIERIAM